MIRLGPTGAVSRGHVLDVAVKPFTRALQDYDPQLYPRWNPRKFAGWGAWEIRRRPETKSVVDYAVYEGNTYVRLEYAEIPLVSVQLIVPYLNYLVLEKLRDMDTWVDGKKGATFGKELEYKEAKSAMAYEDKAYSDYKYNMKQIRPLMKQFQELVQSGVNPASILAPNWDKTGSK